MSEAHCGCDSFHAYVITVFKFFSFQASMFLPAWWSPSDMVVRRMRLWEFHSKKNQSSIGFKFFRETQKRKKARCRYTSSTLHCLLDFMIFLKWQPCHFPAMAFALLSLTYLHFIFLFFQMLLPATVDLYCILALITQQQYHVVLFRIGSSGTGYTEQNYMILLLHIFIY